jgi:hypothetical protein
MIVSLEFVVVCGHLRLLCHIPRLVQCLKRNISFHKIILNGVRRRFLITARADGGREGECVVLILHVVAPLHEFPLGIHID